MRLSRLSDIHQILGNSIRMKAIHEVYWLSQADVVTTVVRCHEALEVYFGETADVHDDPGAHGIYKALTDAR